ncbi:MAG TPA: class I SAM-dependent methyltransferase [Solirubrobacteraceae bacterium]|nr:class I SAM-dependent methyltransferase [Solirubrobacteraceae bacterium]
MSSVADVIWHDLECGSYHEDLALWRALAARHGGPVLDIGAGTGRVSLELARAGHEVIALDRDATLLGALQERARAAGLTGVQTICADACEFTVPAAVPLCIVPMQTIQLLDGAGPRSRFFAQARTAVRTGGVLALAIADALEPFEVANGSPEPLPDVGEFDGIVYSSRPLAVRPDGGHFVLERRRETVSVAGELAAETDLVRLHALDADLLEAEGRAAGFDPAPREAVATTPDYVGSTVVILRG